ncbi:MAG: hypothetical protein HeimC3_53420 [Candidatus Heimdallarchaeota archaeon LC_3]|nr:MAG: hypothetical protein HeimC3_53420 [Candidatus Heimdallarchaeota archaeon LC_3]
MERGLLSRNANKDDFISEILIIALIILFWVFVLMLIDSNDAFSQLISGVRFLFDWYITLVEISIKIPVIPVLGSYSLRLAVLGGGRIKTNLEKSSS